MGFDTMEINLVVVVVVKIVVAVTANVVLWPCLLLLIISYLVAVNKC